MSNVAWILCSRMSLPSISRYGDWDVSNVQYGFYVLGASSFNQPIGDWNE